MNTNIDQTPSDFSDSFDFLSNNERMNAPDVYEGSAPATEPRARPTANEPRPAALAWSSVDDESFTLEERVNPVRLREVLACTSYVEAETIKFYKATGKPVNADGYSFNWATLRDYSNAMTSKGVVAVSYKKAAVSEETDGTGRYYCGGRGLQAFPRPIRQYITRGDTEDTSFIVDLDMCNAHPTILLQILDEHEIDCKVLRRYVNKRKAFLETVAAEVQSSGASAGTGAAEYTTAHAKVDILAIMNAGGPSHYAHSRTAATLSAEMKAAAKALAALGVTEKYREARRATAHEASAPIESRMMIAMVNDVENRILHTMYKSLTSRGFTVSSLVFDGLFVRVNKAAHYEEVMARVEAAIPRICAAILDDTGFEMKLATKRGENILDRARFIVDGAHQSLVSVVPSESPEWLSTLLEGSSNHSVVSDTFIELFCGAEPSIAIYEDELYRLDAKTNLWAPMPNGFTIVEHMLKPRIVAAAAELKCMLDVAAQLEFEGAVKKAIALLGSTHFLESVYRQLKSKLSLHHELPRGAFNNKVGVTVWSCGTTYDLATGAFSRAAASDFHTHHTGFPYRGATPEHLAAAEEFLRKMQPDPEYYECMISCVGSSYAGYNKSQKMVMFTGSGGNGKSVLANLAKAIFGNYYYSMSGAYLYSVSKGSDHDSSMYGAKGKRALFIEECDTNGDGGAKQNVIISSKVKVMAGDSEISARQIHKAAGTSFKLEAVPICCVNGAQRFEGGADGGIARRIVYLDFNQRFVVNTGNTVLEEGEQWADTTIAQTIFADPERLAAFQHIFIEAARKYMGGIYEPAAVTAASNEKLSDVSSLELWLATHYVVDALSGSKMFSDELRTEYNASNPRTTCSSVKIFGQTTRKVFGEPLDYNRKKYYTLRSLTFDEATEARVAWREKLFG